MSSLMIKNLPLIEELDREAACAVRGGDLKLTDPGIMPGGCVHDPWSVPPLPTMPEMPQIPEWWPQPGWPFPPSPGQPDPLAQSRK